MAKIRLFVSTGFMFLCSAAGLLAANITSITGVSISPSSPSPGETVTVSWVYNIDSSFNNPHALVVVSNSSSLQPAGTAGQYIVLGDGCAPSAEVAGGCAIGTNVTAGAVTYSTSITIPSALTAGGTYYVIVGMKDYNVYMNPSVSVDRQNFISFSIPLPPPYITLTKVAEGTTANVGDKVLFTVNYDAGNITNFKITDAVDARFTILKIFNGGTVSGSTITWTLGNISIPQKSSVSFLVQVNAGPASGDIIPNSALGSSNEVASSVSNTARVTIALPGLSILKSVSSSTAAAGDTLTYTMSYSNTGTTLSEYQNFDDGIVPGGWTESPTGGTWDAAPGYLRETAALGTIYPAIMDSTMTPLHDAIYTVDMRIDPSDPILDAVFRFNWADTNDYYMARISSDSDDLGFDKVSGGTFSAVAGVTKPRGMDLLAGSWYTVKIQVCGSTITMKAYPQGSAEPAGWDISTTDSSIPGTGIAGFQSNQGPVAFDNFKAFSLTSASGPYIYDPVPPEITYTGCSGGTGCGLAGGVVNWSISGTCAGNAGVTWWGIVNGADCGPITNTAYIDSADPPPAASSNSVYTTITSCASTPTNTPTATPTATATPSPTNTPVYTPTKTPTITPTSTPTQTPTITFTPTITSTTTATFTPTPPYVDIFTADKNVFSVSADKAVTITVEYNKYPGPYDLWIYNSAGEHIKTLDTKPSLTGPISQVYSWDGTNKNNDACASGLYILYLVEPFDKKLKRLILVR